MAHPLGEFVIALDGSSLPDRALIGGKAWSVAHMQSLGLPVPPAAVITTAACRAYLELGACPASLDEEIDALVSWLEQQTGRTLGGGDKPLLLSVRSGAAISMPGMMDTVLNLGINPATEAALAQESGDAEFARDTHCRFLQLYASIVLKLSLPPDAGQPAELLAAIEAQGGAVPTTAKAQLRAAVEAVFASWNSRRAKRYRKHNNIADSLGTAVTVQAMVFGNLDAQSGTGVLFSRNPLTGAPEPYGEYLHRAQGEDVVSGNFTPEPLSALATAMPSVHEQLLVAATALEQANRDVQDIEFTVQHGELFLLQSRAAKRAPQAAVRFAADMVSADTIDTTTALERLSAEQIRTLLKPSLADGATAAATRLAGGEAACQGVGVGVVVTDSDEAERRHAAGEAVVLARANTSPEDVHGMIAAVAVVTEHGGSTSHAAVVGRALGVPCIVGCGADSVTILAGQTVTVDGNSGNVYAGALPVVEPAADDDPALAMISEWARAACPLEVLPATAENRAGACDLDQLEGGEDPQRLAELLAGQHTVCGGAIESDAGVAAAIAAGVKTIVATQPLPVMLAAIHAASA